MKSLSIVLSYVLLISLCGLPPIQADPCFASSQNNNGCAEIIIFSYDRPLQVYALLKSIDKYVTGCARTTIIYKTTNNNFKKGYEIVEEDFPQVNYVWEGSEPEVSFHDKFVRLLHTIKTPYFLLGNDDNLIIDFVNLYDCTQQLKDTNAYGFYLRCGMNTDYCYTNNVEQGIPPLTNIANGIYAWRFCDGAYDWAYPNGVEFTITRTAELVPILCSLPFNSPHGVEAHWANNAGAVMQRHGLCFERAPLINLPLNIVKQDWKLNRQMNSYTPQELLDIFFDGKQMDIDQFYGYEARSVHVEANPQFIYR